jgi:hypothetical protein
MLPLPCTCSKQGSDLYLRLSDAAQCDQWRRALLDPLSQPVFVDQAIETETREAMQKSIAIIRGETGKIELSYGKYEAGKDARLSSRAATAASTAAAATSSNTQQREAYSAFKNRSFIYDDDSQEAAIDAASKGSPQKSDTPTVTGASTGASPSIAEEDSGENDSDDARLAASSEDDDDDDDEDENVSEYHDSAKERGAKDVTDSAAADATTTSSSSASAHNANIANPMGATEHHYKKGKPGHNAAPKTRAAAAAALANAADILPRDKNSYISHSQYSKGGDSWIRKSSSEPQTPATPSTKQPVQLIPNSDNRQPLARRESKMINQCMYFMHITVFSDV